MPSSAPVDLANVNPAQLAGMGHPISTDRIETSADGTSSLAPDAAAIEPARKRRWRSCGDEQALGLVMSGPSRPVQNQAFTQHIHPVSQERMLAASAVSVILAVDREPKEAPELVTTEWFGPAAVRAAEWLGPEPDAAVPKLVRKGDRRGSKCVLWHEQGNLFEVPADWSMCHCISQDLSLGAGISVHFKKEFGTEHLRRQPLEVGGVSVLRTQDRHVYQLVTKNKKGGKPSMRTMEAALVAMRAHILQDGVRKLAMPKIGCGLDRLQWSKVEDLVLRVFHDVEIEILVRDVRFARH